MKNLVKYILLVVFMACISDVAMAQKKKRTATKRTTTKRATTKTTEAPINATDTSATRLASGNDSLPMKKVLPSLRPDEAVETTFLNDRTPLPYENLRADDAVYRHKIWREIDGREKINQPFMYAADEGTSNQRFISILMNAIQNDSVTAFSNLDDRFTTPLTRSEISKMLAGEPVTYEVFDADGNVTGTKTEVNPINLDSFYKFRIKEEVIFDKESSRLFWRILGIAPVRKIKLASGIEVGGETELFWLYYPDLRATFAKSNVFNGKNFGARMSWEELFESRMFSGRIIKSTIDNPFDLQIKDYDGIKDKPILQLLQGESMKEKIFNYEQDLWSY